MRKYKSKQKYKGQVIIMAFSEKSLDFLCENRLQNSKLWFEEHKPDYTEHVLSPMQELVRTLTPTMLSIDSGFITEPRVDKTISRIYRDTRFSKDKSLYRDNCWFTFMREKKLYMGLPAYWFEINPAGFGYGMGYYQASGTSMESIRKMALSGDKLFKKAWSAYKAQSLFSLEGDLYKKTRHPEQPEELRNFLDRKSVSFNCYSSDFKMLFSDELPDVLKHGYEILKPIYQFLCAAELTRDE